MDLEDNSPMKKPETWSARSLNLLSLAELEQRIQDLESEIVRIVDSLTRKQRRKGSCRRIFQR